MDSEMLSAREQKFSLMLQQERTSEGYSHQSQAHNLSRTYDQPSTTPRTDRTEPSHLGTVPDLRYNRIDLSQNARPLLSQFRLSDHMPINSLPRSLTGLCDLKNNFQNKTNTEKKGLNPHSLLRGVSLTSSSQMDTSHNSPSHQQTRAQSPLDLHKPFSLLETRTAMGSQMSLKSFNHQSPEMNSTQQLNHSYTKGVTGSSENYTDRSPPYNVFSYQSRKSNTTASVDGGDRSRTVIVKSTLCYNTSTQTDIPFTDSMADPCVGTSRMRFEDLQTGEVTSPGLSKKIERFGKFFEDKSVQTVAYREVCNPSLDLKVGSKLFSNNIKYPEVIQHSHDIVQYGLSSYGDDRKQADIYSANTDRNRSGNYIRQSSYEYNKPLESSQKNQIRYASQDILNGDLLHHRLSTDTSFFNTAPAFHTKQNEDPYSKSDRMSENHTSSVLSRDPPSSSNQTSPESARCFKDGTDSNNNICSHRKTSSDLYPFSDYGSTTGSYDSRHIPSVFSSAVHLGSSVGSHVYSYHTPQAFISRSRSSSMTIYDHEEATKVHNLSLTSGVGSDVSSMYSYPRSPPLDSSHDTTFIQTQQSFSHARNDASLAPLGSSTFQWKKIVILNPEHVRTSRRGSDSVFLDEDDVEPKVLLYKDFRQKTFPAEVPFSPNRQSKHTFHSEGLNQVTSNVDNSFKPRDSILPDPCVPPSPKSRIHRVSESLSLGQIQEEAETFITGRDKSPRIKSNYENISFTDGRSIRSRVEKYGNEPWQNEPWRRGSFDLSSEHLKPRRSEMFVEATENFRRNSLDSAKLHRNSYQGGDNSPALSAFRNYKKHEHSTPSYSMSSSQDLGIARRESDLQITRQQLHKLEAANRYQGLRSNPNDSKDPECERMYMPTQYYEEDSSSSSSTLRDISSLDNSTASIRNPSAAETVAELIVKVNENLTKSAERMGRIRRSGSISSRSSLDSIDTTRPERTNRRETDWTRIRSLGSLRFSPERDHWLNWSSFASDDLNDDTGILTSSTPRSSFALSRDKENMLEASSHNASMDSGLVVSPIYQNFPAQRRPPPPPRPAASSDPEPPPLPPRMNRDKPKSPSGTRAALDPEPTQYHGSGKEKHRIEVIPLGKPQDHDIRVDTSKMNFKDLMKQWKSNSPGENSSPSDLRRHDQKNPEKHQCADRSMSSGLSTFERNKTTPTSVASTYRHDSSYNLDATSPVFSPVSSLSTPHSSASRSAFYTSPYSPSGAVSETSPSQQHSLGFQPSSFSNTNSAVYPGRQNTISSSVEALSTNALPHPDGFSPTPTSSSGLRVTLINQTSAASTGSTPPFGKISYLQFSRSRSTCDLLSDQLAGDKERSVTTESAPVKLHRRLRDRSSSHQDILTDNPYQSNAQYHHHFRRAQNNGDLAFLKCQAPEDAQVMTGRPPRGPYEDGIKSTPVANGRLSNSTLALSNGYETSNNNRGFADESYIGHKNKSGRTVGTYKRSVSAVGVQSTGSIQANPSGVSDSTPFRDFSLGQQSWNSESVLSSTGNRVKTLPDMGSQIGKTHTDGANTTSQGHTSGVHSVTPVRPPRPNARGRQNAKQSSATSAASSTSSSNTSQKTSLAPVSVSAPDNVATSVFFNMEHGSVGQKESLQRPGLSTPSSLQYDLNYQDHWLVQQESNSSGTLSPSGQVLDRSPVNSLHHSPYSPQHRQLALNNSLNSSLSRATPDNDHPQSKFIQDSTATSVSPCSPSERFPANSPTKDRQRKSFGTTEFVTSPSLENSPKGPLEYPACSSHYQPHNKISSPQESTHRCSSTPSLNHLRQPSQEEIECEEKAMELAEELDKNDQKLLEVLMQDRMKQRMLYMDGLFSDLTVDREKSGFKQKSRSSMKNRTLDRVVGESCDASGGFKSHSLPRDYQQTTAGSTAALTTELLEDISNRSLDTSSPGPHENLTVIKHKEELVEKLQKKIQVLKDEKLSLQQEIADNILLGQQMCQVADSRCQTQNEKEKFMTFIDDLEKIVRLLLNLSGQLARAENAVQALGPGTDAKLKKLTWDKRERLHAKHEEAKMLKEAIDRRSEQLLCMLQERLSTQELSDYKHFINRKSRLTIQMQDVEDHLALAEQQVVALKRSLPSSAVSPPGNNGET